MRELSLKLRIERVNAAREVPSVASGDSRYAARSETWRS